NKDSAGGIHRALPDCTFSLRVITFVLTKNGGIGKDDEVIPIGFIYIAAPIVSFISIYSFSQSGMRIFALGKQRCDPYEDECGIVDAVLGRDLQGFSRGGRRRNCARAHRPVVRHESKDALRLLPGSRRLGARPDSAWQTGRAGDLVLG